VAPASCARALSLHSVLVANNGLAAVKFMRSLRSWANQTFGNSRAIALVAMATPEDIRINAEHVTLADQFVEVRQGLGRADCVDGGSVARARPARPPQRGRGAPRQAQVEGCLTRVMRASAHDWPLGLRRRARARRARQVPGGTNNNNYANVKLIVQVAERAGVDAVWPGW
jgi:biotin carboxylase